jgi:hypothetical protein
MAAMAAARTIARRPVLTDGVWSDTFAASDRETPQNIGIEYKWCNREKLASANGRIILAAALVGDSF